MKRTLLTIIITVLSTALLLAAFFLFWKRPGSSPLITEKSDVSAHTIIKETLLIGEYASLAYHYTSVVKDVTAKDIHGWTIPFTTKKYIFTYDGRMKLGIDGSKIRVEEAPPLPPTTPTETANDSLPIIRIILPPVMILSHEIIDDSIEVFEQSQTIFNEIKIQDAFRVTAERKREMEEKVMAGDVVNDARASAEQQLGVLLKALPGIQDNYDLVFVWQDASLPTSPLPAAPSTATSAENPAP